jgi:hypothetical protein
MRRLVRRRQIVQDTKNLPRNFQPTIEARKKYPWKDWQNGGWWLAKSGEDFEVTALKFIQGLHIRAYRTGMFVQAFRWPDQDFVQFRFYTGTRVLRNARFPD